MKKFLLTGLFIVVLFSGRAYAWGKQGHKLIAQIAKSQVSKSVADLVTHYLKGQSWEDAACWMDDVKSSGGLDYMRDWHYVNIAKDKTYVKSKSPDVVNQLEYYLKILRNRSMYPSETISEALKIVLHLIGDMAQPMHCGYGDDHGGTHMTVKFLEKSSNLHKVWDSDIIDEKKLDIWACSKTMLALSAKEKKEYQYFDLMLWLNDSRNLLGSAYEFSNGQIDKAYVDRNAEIILKQIVKAGLRLAAVLDANFKERT